MEVLSFSLPATPIDRAPVALLIEPSAGVRARVTGLLALYGYRVRVTASVPDDLGEAALVLVEADRGARAIGLMRRIHALWPQLPIAGVLPWWDDDERDLDGIARFVLHVPMREDQLEGLARLAGQAISSTMSLSTS